MTFKDKAITIKSMQHFLFYTILHIFEYFFNRYNKLAIMKRLQKSHNEAYFYMN